MNEQDKAAFYLWYATRRTLDSFKSEFEDCFQSALEYGRKRFEEIYYRQERDIKDLEAKLAEAEKKADFFSENYLKLDERYNKLCEQNAEEFSEIEWRLEVTIEALRKVKTSSNDDFWFVADEALKKIKAK